jgi:tRNA G18 (ribose-2'-O)-methylase SpoU
VLTRAEERLVRRLRQARRRRDELLFLAEGVRLLEELLDSGVTTRLVLVSPALAETDRGQTLAHRLAERTLVRTVTDPELNALAATRAPQGVLAVAEIPHAELSTVQPR